MEDYHRLSFKYVKILTDLQKILQTLKSEEEQHGQKKEKVCSQSNRGPLKKLSKTSHSRMILRIPSPAPNAEKRICTRQKDRYG